MSGTKFYRQCNLEKPNGTLTTSWIPERVAKVGQLVRLKKRKRDPWEEWTVVSVGSRADEETVQGYSQQYKWTRPHSDI